MTTTLDAALAYAEDGLKVLALEPPIQGDPQSGKRPITALCPNGVLSATTDPTTLRAWWAAHPQAGVGLAIPDDWIVVDVDPRNGGGASYDAIAAEHGAAAWPETLEAATGGGGAHLVYKVPAGARFPGKLPGRKGLDVKGSGGYVVAWPSGHHTGGAYEWVRQTEPAELPEWLAVLERGVASVQGDEGAADRPLTSAEEKSLDEFAAALDPHFELGQRNALALAIGGALRNAGLPPSAADYVLDQLPSTAPEKRLADALRAWEVPVASGMQGLRDILPAWAMAGVEAIDLRPQWKRDAVERAMAARSAVAEPAAETPEPGAGDPAEPFDWFKPFGRRADRTQAPARIDYLIEGLPLASGGKVNALLGAPNAGKSPFALLLAECVAGAAVKEGVSFLGRRVLRPGRVMYIDAETGVLVERRDARMCVGLGLERAAVPLDILHFEAMFTDEFCKALEVELRVTPHALVVVDTYAACLAADIDHNSPQFAHWLRQLAIVSRASGVPVLVLMHERKTQANGKRGGALEMAAGSFQAMGAVQASITLYHPDEDDRTVVAVECSRAPEDSFKTFHVRWRDTDWIDAREGEDRGQWLGLCADVVAAPAPEPTKAELTAAEREKRRAGVARVVFDRLREAGDSSLTGLRAAAPGGNGALSEILGEMISVGIVERFDTGTCSTNGDKVYRYRLAHPSPRVVEARMKWGLSET